MKQLFHLALAVLLVASVCPSQNIILKSTFSTPYDNSGVQIQAPRNLEIDINNDGFKEVLMIDNNAPGNPNPRGKYFLDPITFQTYGIPNVLYTFPNSEYYSNMYITQMRYEGAAEIVSISNGQITVLDAETQSYLLTLTSRCFLMVLDYDQDGLDDIVSAVICTENSGWFNGDYEVYGISTGSYIEPPQDLDIQVSGDDYIVTWASVATASAYRILWSSSIDGVSYTRIGYTTGTTFRHRNQAGQSRGFYRVMSEDNGTGVVRIVGQTSRRHR
jgi:hypothetical protein